MTQHPSPKTFLGLLIWAVVCLLPLDGDGILWWATRFVLLAALAWIPLALELIGATAESAVGLARLTQRLEPWAAMLLVGAFLAPAGSTFAILLTVPWLLWAALLGVRGLLRLAGRLLQRERLLADELCIDLGMLALPVGGIWLLAARANVPFVGFGQPITLLTGMHFHFAGLLMPTVVGLTGRLLRPRGTARQRYRTLAPAACLGTWLVAAGITFGGAAETAGGTLFATLLALTALTLLAGAPARVLDRLAQALLIVALLAPLPAMGLAALYALSRSGLGRSGLGDVSLETMAHVHGTLLAIVFVGVGLIALARVRPMSRLDRRLAR
jgi:hypothetical protein